MFSENRYSGERAFLFSTHIGRAGLTCDEITCPQSSGQWNPLTTEDVPHSRTERGTYLSLNRTCAATSRHGVDRIFLELPLFQKCLPKMRFQQEHFLGVRVRWARFLLLPSQPAFWSSLFGLPVLQLVYRSLPRHRPFLPATEEPA